MRRLTFKSYLMSQCRVFSDKDSTSLYTFSKLSADNARLKDALSLYLALYTPEKLENRLKSKFDYLNRSCEKLVGINEENIDVFLQDKNKSEFRTIYDNFLYAQNYQEKENNIKTLMYNKILYLKEEKHITNYCIYKKLNLNPGNTNTFLKNGDVRKVSLDTVRKILAFVNEY
ncbi:hypothetical protein B5F08_04695 [Anaeromassilibacillus sp. An172]|uniref:hypothetical protein n=1 Tax=Anaeromassilibacillus sp. An172 TaxID=1965570 RepID=UPI000B399403|nr:hypothetical protein [Anaeromassilibacillus sp. An172]OUP79504.1 hypothetical protein B5F08_04695 [Anaeromassilibacillus sp. An172]